MRPTGRPRGLTADDIAMTLELQSEGVSLSYIAHYAFGITCSGLWHQLRTWGAI